MTQGRAIAFSCGRGIEWAIAPSLKIGLKKGEAALQNRLHPLMFVRTF
ncbi:MAG: hypothetical protein ACBR12_08175 [Microcoleus sp.]